MSNQTPPPILNIVQYQANPFSQSLSVTRLDLATSGTISYEYASSALRALRQKFKDRAFVNSGSSLFLAGPPPADIEKLEFDIPNSSSFRIERTHSVLLDVSNPQQHELLERFMGEAVATWLRQHRLGGWIVVEGRNAVFEAEKAYDDSYEPSLEIWRGFVFNPNISESGEASITVDPRFKIYPALNLRQHLDKISGEIRSRIREQPLILDSCPLNSCPIRSNPYGPCRFIGSGRYVKLVDLDYSRLPSDVIIPKTDKNLIQYNEGVCPLGLLSSRFANAEPVAIVRIGDRTYDYLPERLRLRTDIAFSLLGETSRRRTTRMIQMPPHERYQMTQEIWSFLSRVEIPGFPKLVGGGLVRAGSFEPYRNWCVFPEPTLAVKDIRNIDQPYRMLVRYGPFDCPDRSSPIVRGFSRLEVKPILITHKKNSRCDSALDVLRTFTIDTGPSGLAGVFRIDTSVQAEMVVSTESDVTKAMGGLETESSDDTRVILYLIVDRSADSLADDLRNQLIRLGRATQTSHVDTLLDSGKLSGVLRNIGLSVYCKVGGTPWVLSDALDPRSLYVGTATIPGRDYDSLTIQIYDGLGRWLAGVCAKADKNAYSSELVGFLDAACRMFPEYDQLILHRGGSVNQEREVRPLIDAYRKRNLPISSLSIIELTKSRVRLYTQTGKKVSSSPRGTYVKYLPDCAALLTTIAPVGTPNPIDVRMIYGDTNLLENRAKEIFNLCNVFSGYERASTSMPATVHSCQKALSMSQFYNLYFSDYSTVPWFIQK